MNSVLGSRELVAAAAAQFAQTCLCGWVALSAKQRRGWRKRTARSAVFAVLQYGQAYAGRVQDGTGMLAAAAAIDLLSPGSLAASRRQRHTAQQAPAPTPAPTPAAATAAADVVAAGEEAAAAAGVAAGEEAARVVEQGQAGEQDATQQDKLLVAAVAEQQQAHSEAVAAAKAAAAEAEAAAAEAEAAAHAAVANVLAGDADQGVVAAPEPGSAGQQGQQQQEEEGGGMDVDGAAAGRAQQPSWSAHTSPLALLL